MATKNLEAAGRSQQVWKGVAKLSNFATDLGLSTGKFG